MGDAEDRSGRDDAQPSRRLAAIMFTDLVGYSALAHRDEELAIELLDLHRAWIREMLPRHSGREIETVGDAFLIEFPGALAAVSCALAIQQRFAEHNLGAPEQRRMQLRIGIHLGDVEHRGDKVVGDGVNIASRIHGVAEPGGICVSEDVYHAVRNRSGLRFESLGKPELKNIGTALELFRVEAPVAPTRVVRGTSPRRRRWIVAAVGGGLAAAAGLGLWLERGSPVGTAPSIAVLPFDNLSADPDSAYFTDGLHDTVIGHLARVRDLKVISRTSVMPYRDTKASLREIGRELGVNHVVEGSVQRVGGRLRVAAQLIEATTDTHLWSREYDRDLADVFAVQADIARQVASAVHAQLTPQEKKQIERVPTQNAAAYDLYLRALQAWRRFEPDPRRQEALIGWLEQAVALDPGFALAHALLAQAHDGLHWYGFDPTPARRAAVARHVDEALRLDPNLAEARMARAQHLYHGRRDYDGALRELEAARTLAPGLAEVHFWLGAIYRRQARWEDAVAGIETAATLDPFNELFLQEYAGTLHMLRRYADADAIYARLEHLSVDAVGSRHARAVNRFAWTGDLESLERLLAAAPAGYDPACALSFDRFWTRFLRRRFADAAAAIAGCREPYLGLSAGERVPKEYYAAIAHAFTGDGAALRRVAVPLRAALDRSLRDHDDQPVVRTYYAFTLAILGDGPAAEREMDRALAQMPTSRDSMIGSQVVLWSAALHAYLGNGDRALADLERALRLPGPLPQHAHFVRQVPWFDRLRDDPRFQRLVDANLPKAAPPQDA